MLANLAILLLLSALAFGSSKPPTVKLDDATVIGVNSGLNDQFLGIPFAQAPLVNLFYLNDCICSSSPRSRVGKLRLQLPQPIPHYTGVINATTFGNQCIQQTIITPTIPSNFPPQVEEFVAPMGTVPDVPQSEDCTLFTGH